MPGRFRRWCCLAFTGGRLIATGGSPPGVGAFAAMVLSHHLFAFLFAPVFGLWVIASALSRRSWAVLLRGAMLGFLGLGITAFFWLPAVAERSLVQTGRLLGTWVFDYRYNFLSVGDMLALPRPADPSLLNDWPEKALGLVPVLLALLSLSAWRRLSRPARWQVGALWVTALGSAFSHSPHPARSGTPSRC